ncbi:acylphosphatase [Blautia producta]|uniref:acylphosphatase n=1 Tax=Blautia producta TaxID=33035 RepID=A0A4P6LZR6_9FIRM|nr:acylphosphatase [Blautia producta]QBE96623.1 Acylphosphatase [Blautia producta]
MKIRKHFILTGMVQGVGLRYRAQHLARLLQLTGWVKNTWDGCVELELQGREEEISSFLDRLSMGNFIRIEGVEAKDVPVIEENGFHVKG